MTMKERLEIIAEALKRTARRDAEHAQKQKPIKGKEEQKCRSKAH